MKKALIYTLAVFGLLIIVSQFGKNDEKITEAKVKIPSEKVAMNTAQVSKEEPVTPDTDFNDPNACAEFYKVVFFTMLSVKMDNPKKANLVPFKMKFKKNEHGEWMVYFQKCPGHMPFFVKDIFHNTLNQGDFLVSSLTKVADGASEITWTKYILHIRSKLGAIGMFNDEGQLIK